MNLSWAGSGSSVSIHWYIMTSPFTHDSTRFFFENHKYFGLEADQVRKLQFINYLDKLHLIFYPFLLNLNERLIGCRLPSSSKAPYLVFPRMADLSWRLHLGYGSFS
jgi:hypothetical protein